MRLVTWAYTITILFFCVGSLILFLEADAVKEQPQSTVNINNNQNIKRSRYFDEYDDPQANLLALELAATSSEQDHDKQKIKTTAEKISSFIKDIKNKVQKGNEPIKSPEELEKNPFAKSDVATKSQQTTAAQSKDNMSIRILPNASKKFVAFLFVIFAIAVFSTYYVITSRKEGTARSENKSAVLKKPNKTTVAVADDGTINIKHNNNNSSNNEKTSVKPKRSVIIQDLDASKNDGENTNNNTNINNIDNKNEIKKEELHEETDPKEESHDDLANDTNEATNEKRSKNSSNDETTDNSVNEKSNKDEQQISPRRKVQISPRVTEPDEHHLASDDDEHGQDPEYEEDVHEKIVLSSSSSQIRAKKNSPRVHEINTEIAEHQHTIQLLERETTPDNAIKIRELKMFVTDLKLRKMEIEEKMASNALSFEQIKEMQRQNKFKRKAKREEISKSSEYRNAKTTLTEKQNQIQSQSLKLKGEKNEREVAEQKRRHEKELQEIMWNEFIFVMKVTLVIFVVFWGIHLWQTMSFSVIVSLVRQKFGEFVQYLLPSTTRNLSFLSKVPVVGALLSGAGSFLGILFLLLGFVAYAVGFYFIGSYFANTLLLTLVMLGFGAWRHVVTGGMTFVTLASIEYVVIRQLKHHMNSPKYSLIYIPFVIFAAVLGYFTAFNVVSIDVPIQVAANSSLVNNVWSRVSKLVFK